MHSNTPRWPCAPCSDRFWTGYASTLQENATEVQELRTVFAVLLFELAAAVNAFGGLVRAEVEESTAAEEAATVAALDTLREARARVTELHLVEARDDMVTWELNEAILEAVERVLRELDVRNRRAVERPVIRICPTQIDVEIGPGTLQGNRPPTGRTAVAVASRLDKVALRCAQRHAATAKRGEHPGGNRRPP